MLHTKFRENRPAGSGEEDFWRVFTIYGRGGHLGHVTQMPRTNFCSPYPRRLHIKFGFDWPSGFREEEVWNCLRRTPDDGRTPDHEYPISSPMSRWLRWAKKAPYHSVHKTILLVKSSSLGHNLLHSTAAFVHWIDRNTGMDYGNRPWYEQVSVYCTLWYVQVST